MQKVIVLTLALILASCATTQNVNSTQTTPRTPSALMCEKIFTENSN